MFETSKRLNRSLMSKCIFSLNTSTDEDNNGTKDPISVTYLSEAVSTPNKDSVIETCMSEAPSPHNKDSVSETCMSDALSDP